MKINFCKALLIVATALLTNTVNAQSTTTGNIHAGGRFLGWGATSGDLEVRVNNTAHLFMKNITGNIGIGTSTLTPTHKLTVGGTIGWGTGSASSSVLSTDQGGNIELGATNTSLNPVTNGSPYLDFHYGISPAAVQDFNMRIINNANNRLDFAQSGNVPVMTLNNLKVGIGTINPYEALQIGDRFTFHSGGYKGICNNFTYDGGDKRIVADYACGIFLTNSGNILFKTAASGAANSAISWLTNMTISNDGKILIGNAGLPNFQGTPGTYLLYVQKGILTEKVKIAVATTADWSDYVFASDYKLKTIEELEAFVKENKHLPNIPSAEEVVKEGIDMAKMDAKLLEKIEELSLYIIQLKKENVELVKRMEKIETK